MGCLLLAGLLVCCCFRATVSKVARFSMGFLALLSLLCASLGGFAIWFTPVAKVQTVWSPDGRHVALVRKQLHGDLGSDRMVLRIRRTWIPWSNEVYLGASNDDDASFLVQWVDSRHLLISGDKRICGQHDQGVELICN
jgi:hypothetical protein